MRFSRKSVRFALALVSAAALSVTSGLASDSADWWQWRGAARDGSAPGVGWPDSLEGLEKMWSVPLGKGYPGPIIGDDRVFVVETVDKKNVAVRALSLETGEELWSESWPSGGSVPFFAASNGDWVRSTPAYDGTTLYVGDMREVLVALDGATGEERWRVDFVERFGTKVPDFGFASSPLIDGDFLYVQAANSLVKLNKRDGTTVWRSLEHSGEISASGAFSSPVIAEIHGDRQLVVLTRHTLNGVSPEDGAVLWSTEVPSFRGMNILTPVVVGNSIFTSPYRQASFLFDIRNSQDGFEVVESWSNKSTGYMSTPVVIDGHVYMHLGNQRFECVDIETGEARWRTKPFGKYWSLAARGGKILGLDSEGKLYLVKANPEQFELLDSRPVSDDDTWAHVAVSGDLVLIRELRGVSAFRFGPPQSEDGANALGDEDSNRSLTYAQTWR